uniref:Endonuclease/exonuclease/phosphatase domain-containing protein n=1 Tax=Panagrolaimus davidi TaxID=227884 RepID=A0A914PKQ3_9BILA
MELAKLKKFDVLGLAETWIPGQTCVRLANGMFLYNSGKTGDARFSGTGLMISAEMNRKVIGVNKTLRITQVYAPQSGRGEDEYDAFLEQLSSSLARPSTYDIVLGDFNASTGPRENGERFIGKYSWDSRNERGELLCQFLIIVWFEQL